MNIEIVLLENKKRAHITRRKCFSFEEYRSWENNVVYEEIQNIYTRHLCYCRN